MRLGPKERVILTALSPDGEFVPPSVYMAPAGGFGSCPSGYTLNRLVDKGLVEPRYMTWTPEEARQHMAAGRAPGRETAEFNAALRLTRAGIEARARILPAAEPAK